MMFKHAHIVPPSSATLTSNVTNSLQIIGSDIELTCTVELNSVILVSEIFLLTVNAQLSSDGTLLALTSPIVTAGTVFIYTTRLNSFQKSNFGNYTCTATVTPQQTSTYLVGVDVSSDMLNIKPCTFTMMLMYHQ